MSTNFISKVNFWLIYAQYCLLPGTCIQCNKASERNYDLCQACEIKFPRIKDPCQCCGLPLPANNYDGHLCGTCILSPPPYKHIVAAFNYSEPINHLIRTFKYQSKLAFGKVLSQQLLQVLLSFYDNQELPGLLIPMPLHTTRLHQRGFNQSLVIGKFLSRHLNIPLNFKLCKRDRNTLPQEGLNLKARKENLHKAFSIPKIDQNLPRSVAIIDDVVTTTASTRELSILLKSHGVKEVHIWTLARAYKK